MTEQAWARFMWFLITGQAEKNGGVFVMRAKDVAYAMGMSFSDDFHTSLYDAIKRVVVTPGQCRFILDA